MQINTTGPVNPDWTDLDAAIESGDPERIRAASEQMKANPQPVIHAPTPTRLNTSTLRERRRRRETGEDFVLHNTTDEFGNPTIATVRVPDILDANTLAMLPDSLRMAIFSVVEKAEQMQKSGDADADGMSTRELVESFGNVGQMADAYVITGFINPRVYATTEEADANDGAWVRDIEFADRIAFFDWCARRERGAVSTAAPFPGGQVSPVGTGHAGQAVSGPGVTEPGAAPEPEAPAGS